MMVEVAGSSEMLVPHNETTEIHISGKTPTVRQKCWLTRSNLKLM
jgi:hypothetical protein